MMAGRKKEYVQKAITKSIAATSRASVKIKDNFYTVEYHEERIIPETDDINLTEEKKMLWDAVNAECDAQIEDILKTFKK